MAKGATRTIIRVLLVAILFGTFTGFSAAPKTERVKIRFWERASGAGGPLELYLKELNKAQNKFEYVYQGYGEQYNNVLTLALQSGDAPELFSPGGQSILPWAEAGLIQPIDEILTKRFKSQFEPSMFETASLYYKGKIYTIPERLHFYRLLYNKDLFRAAGLDPNKPPRTLEELRATAKKITEAGKGRFYGFGGYLNYAEMWLRHIDMLSIAEGQTGPCGFDFLTGRFDFAKQKKYFQFWVDMYKDGSLFPGATSLGVEQMRAYFAAGQVAMMIDGSWMPKIYATTIPNKNDWDAAPIPIYSGAKRAKDYLAYGVMFCVGTGKNSAMAKEALKLYWEKIMMVRQFGDSDPKTYLAANTKKALALLPKDKPYQAVDRMFDIKNHAAFQVEPHKLIKLEGDSNEKVWTRLFVDAVNGKTDKIDSTIQDMTDRYNKALDRALAEGMLKPEQLKPANFSYYKR